MRFGTIGSRSVMHRHGVRIWGVAVVALLSSSARVAQAQASTVIPTGAGEEAARTRAAVLSQKISLHLPHSTLGEALKTINARAGVRLIYSRYAVPVRKPVSLVVDSITVGDALTFLLRDTGVEVVVSQSGWITLRTMEDARDVVGAGESARQGGGIIAGFVTDSATGAPVPQVAVRIEGTGLGAVSGPDGRYTIAGVAAGEYRVTVRRVGYVARTRAVTVVDGRTMTLNFALNQPATRLDEVVTTAVGQQRRYEVGNDISTINVDSIAPTAPIRPQESRF
jgi:hypothetical protein